MAGRRPKRSPEREEAILNALRVGNTRQASYRAAEISVTTFYDWIKDPIFLEAVEKAEADAELRFLGTVAKAAASGRNWQAAAWWLERRQHEFYGRRDRVDMSVDLKTLAERIAAEDGLDAAAMLAEAERILTSR